MTEERTTPIESVEQDTTLETNTEEAKESEMEQRRQQLEDEFSYDPYLVVRKELFAHLRDPAVTVRNGNITFNTACINGMEDVVYVKLMFSESLGRLVVRPCNENDKDALRWCVTKPDKRKSRKMTCPDFTNMVYNTMGWDKSCRYKILGYRITFDGESLYVFDLKVPEIFHEKPRKKKGGAVPDNTPAPVAEGQEGEQQIAPVTEQQETQSNTRKGFYAKDIANTFGVPVKEHDRQTEVSEQDGYVTIGMISGTGTEQNPGTVQSGDPAANGTEPLGAGENDQSTTAEA